MSSLYHQDSRQCGHHKKTSSSLSSDFRDHDWHSRQRDQGLRQRGQHEKTSSSLNDFGDHDWHSHQRDQDLRQCGEHEKTLSNLSDFRGSHQRNFKANGLQPYQHQQSQQYQHTRGTQRMNIKSRPHKYDDPRYFSSSYRDYTENQLKHAVECCQPKTCQTKDQLSHSKLLQEHQHRPGSMVEKRVKQLRKEERYSKGPHWTQKSNKGTCTETLEQSLPFPAEGINAVYTNDPLTAEVWLQNHVIDLSTEAIGLDIEWKPQFKKKKDGGVENKTAVLQLAANNSCLVLHLIHMQSFPKSLATVLGDKTVLKVGSGILGDAVKLRRDCHLTCIGRADTQVLAKDCKVLTNGFGLKSLAKALLNIDLKKPKHISMSNWEQFPLNANQIQYAAMDAWISLKVYLHLKGMLQQSEGISTASCDVSEPVVSHMVICEACGKKCKGNEELVRHLEQSGHARCGICNKLCQSHVSKKHKKKCFLKLVFGRLTGSTVVNS